MSVRIFGKRMTVVGILILIGLTSACVSNHIESPPPPPLAPNSEITPRGSWLLVDTKADTLTVMQDNRPVEVFRQIALGTSGAGMKLRRGDNKTPVGVFRVGWVNDNSRFKTFIGLDYPNPEYAERALRERRISQATYERIRAAWASGYTPPQDTPLGGQIGIHGVGAGDPGVHGAGINWTSGCVALDNRQIKALRPWVKKGMRVEIR